MVRSIGRARGAQCRDGRSGRGIRTPEESEEGEFQRPSDVWTRPELFEERVCFRDESRRKARDFVWPFIANVAHH